MPFSLNAQQATEELPEALGTYLSAMEGLIKCGDISLGYAWATDQYTFYTYGYKEDRIYPTLQKWSAPEVRNVSGQNLSIILYFTLGARDPERVKLYRLRTGKDVKPFITIVEDVKLSAVPITEVPGMVRLIPERVLTKGNYIFVEGDIDSKLLFSIESKFQLLGANSFKKCLEILNSFQIMKRDLQKEFENKGISISDDANITVIDKNSRWQITNRDNKEYLVKKQGKRLDIYDSSDKPCSAFTVDGGEELWRTPAIWEKCISCLCRNGYTSTIR